MVRHDQHNSSALAIFSQQRGNRWHRFFKTASGKSLGLRENFFPDSGKTFLTFS